MRYIYDFAKQASNFTEHGVLFDEANEFDWESALVVFDWGKPNEEPRLTAAGLVGNRVHVMVFTLRDTYVRILSLRRANSREVGSMPTTPRKGRKLHVPSPEEDKSIDAGVSADEDNGALTDAFFAKAKPVAMKLGAAKAAEMVAMRRPRGRPAGSVAERTKVALNMRVDPDVLAAMRDSGAGWQTRVNDLLRREFVRGGRKRAQG